MKIYEFLISIDYPEENSDDIKSIQNMLYVIANNQEEAIQKIAEIASDNEIGLCDNCLCEFLENNNSIVLKDNEENTLESEDFDEEQKCKSCENESNKLYNLVDSDSKVKIASLCSTCLADLLASQDYSII